MTYNVGKLKDDPNRSGAILDVIQHFKPDVLALQELTITKYRDGLFQSFATQLITAMGYSNVIFGQTISLREHFHLNKELFIDGIFQGWKEWQMGNAIFSKYPYVDISDSQVYSDGFNIPIFKPIEYLGSRDTDPRYAIISRLEIKPHYPYIVNTHFTTLVGERGKEEEIIPGKKEEAIALRLEQARRISALVKKHIVEQKRMLFLCGDFNAMEDEACIKDELERKVGLTRLVPENVEPTHPKLPKPVDHIFIYAGTSCVKYRCHIVDEGLARKASDHLPVLAYIEIFGEDTKEYQSFGAGVFPM